MELILSAFANLLTIGAIVALVAGCLAGITVGMLPGLSSTMAVALCIPITFALPADQSLILLGAVYVSSTYGGSITAILLRAPGTDASIVTALDGYPLTQAGRGLEAIRVATVASLFGGIFSVVVLLSVAPLLSKVALAFGPQEYTLLAVFGLVTIIGVVSSNRVKGMISALGGLALAFIGLDNFTGIQRYTYNQPELFDGLPILPLLIGLFSVSQALSLCASKGDSSSNASVPTITDQSSFSILATIRRYWIIFLRSSVVGSIVGILPGAGTSIAAFIAYDDTKRRSGHPERFGKGEIEGVAAAESANNAVTGGTLIPTLTLGIPGNAVTAVFVGGLTVHGMIPGPRLFTEHAETTYTLILSLLFANILFAALGLLLVRHLVRVTEIDKAIVGPLIIAFSVIGTYVLRNEIFDVWLVIIFGVLGYFMERWRYPTAPLVLAVILGKILEVNFRRSMQITDWDLTTFVSRPISLVLLTLVLVSIAAPYIRSSRTKTE